MPLSYEPTLVFLSLALAIQGSYISLRIALQIKGAHGPQRRRLLMGAAFSLAVAMWSMHFVAMLAGRLPFAVNFLVLPTILSFLVCVLAAGAAFVSLSIEPRTPLTLVTASIAMGCGVVMTHYIGMWAMRDSVIMDHRPIMAVISIVVGALGSAAALWITFYAARRPPLFICATLLGLAIAGVHYTAIAGTGFSPPAIPSTSGSLAVSPDLLAIVVALVGFFMSGAFLLTLVPEPPKNGLAFSPGQGHPRYGRRSTDRPVEELKAIQAAARIGGVAESRNRRMSDVPDPGVAAPGVEAQRKIAAIMAADVAFFTTLVANDEEETLSLFSIYRGVFENFVTHYQGRVFNTAGDSLMSEFGSAVQAVRAAIEIQDRLRTLNQSRAPERRLQFRIGITIADVVERQGELYGEGVNLAARLESLAPPGGLCVSRAVHESVANKVPVAFRDLGQQTLKHIKLPVHAFIADWPDPGAEPA